MNTPLPAAGPWAGRKFGGRGGRGPGPGRGPVVVPVSPSRSRRHAQVFPGDQGRPEVQDRGARPEALGAVPVRGRGGPSGNRRAQRGGGEAAPGRSRYRAEPAPLCPTAGTHGRAGARCLPVLCGAGGTPGPAAPAVEQRPALPDPGRATLTGQRCRRAGAAGSPAGNYRSASATGVPVSPSRVGDGAVSAAPSRAGSPRRSREPKRRRSPGRARRTRRRWRQPRRWRGWS